MQRGEGRRGRRERRREGRSRTQSRREERRRRRQSRREEEGVKGGERGEGEIPEGGPRAAEGEGPAFVIRGDPAASPEGPLVSWQRLKKRQTEPGCLVRSVIDDKVPRYA